MTLTLDYLRPCTLLDPLRPDLNQDARIDYLPRPTPSWGVRSLYGSDHGAQSDQPRSHPIGPGLPTASLWMAIYPHFPLVGSFLTPVWPQDMEESTITLFHLNMTDILTNSYYLQYALCLSIAYLWSLDIYITSPLYHHYITELHFGLLNTTHWTPPFSMVVGTLPQPGSWVPQSVLGKGEV